MSLKEPVCLKHACWPVIMELGLLDGHHMTRHHFEAADANLVLETIDAENDVDVVPDEEEEGQEGQERARVFEGSELGRWGWVECGWT